MGEPGGCSTRLVASGAVNREGPPGRSSGHPPIVRLAVAVTGTAVLLLAVIGMTVQAYRGNSTVAVQRNAKTVHDAALDNAFYRCLDVQARSLVSPGQPVLIDPSNLADFITLLKGVGSWVRVADPPSSAVALLSLRDHVQGGGACLGTQVIARFPGPHHQVTVRVGSGDSVPGNGPAPAPPL
jgi:hypothetical protein